MEEKKYGTCPECGAPCEVIEGSYKEEIHDVHYVEHKYMPQPGAPWVKASDRLPEWKRRVKWRDGNDHSCATGGEISLFEMEKPNLEGWEWLDESGTAAGREEDAVAFAEWCANSYQWEYDPTSDEYRWLEADNFYTTAQLYELFKQQKEK